MATPQPTAYPFWGERDSGLRPLPALFKRMWLLERGISAKASSLRCSENVKVKLSRFPVLLVHRTPGGSHDLLYLPETQLS